MGKGFDAAAESLNKRARHALMLLVKGVAVSEEMRFSDVICGLKASDKGVYHR
jgi:hypothetical protein